MVEQDTKYTIFKINNEFYGIDVNSVNNIIQFPTITNVPGAPNHYRGIINLRGEIVPVMSLKSKLGSGVDTLTQDSRIIILNVEEDKLLGITVDEVKEVLPIPSSEIEKPSPFINSNESIVKGIGKHGDDLISIISANSIL
ncbi:MAG: chemotaxis protein CheW [Butyrivibrio sp.]|nr:chemotaxis protein CheW [Butyrivibrio sp.]